MQTHAGSMMASSISVSICEPYLADSVAHIFLMAFSPLVTTILSSSPSQGSTYIWVSTPLNYSQPHSHSYKCFQLHDYQVTSFPA